MWKLFWSLNSVFYELVFYGGIVRGFYEFYKNIGMGYRYSVK